MMNQIEFLQGDATAPMTKGTKIIAHICNDIGGWGKGFVLAISKRWPEPEKQYRKWYSSKENFALGQIQIVPVSPYIYVANMIGQKGIKTGSKGVPIRYEAVELCLEKLAEQANALNASIHMPRIGCGLAGGKWEIVEEIIQRQLIQKGLNVYVYDTVSRSKD